jgi:hypothetical protein
MHRLILGMNLNLAMLGDLVYHRLLDGSGYQGLRSQNVMGRLSIPLIRQALVEDFSRQETTVYDQATSENIFGFIGSKIKGGIGDVLGSTEST